MHSQAEARLRERLEAAAGFIIMGQPANHTSVQLDDLRSVLDSLEAMRGALRLYLDAGFGESTDFHAQGKAYDTAIRLLTKDDQ